MTDISLCGLFLLHAAKQVQVALKTSFHSSFHTVADTSHDVQKMVTYLLEERATSDTGRTGTEFECSLKKGSKKMGSAFQNFITNIYEPDDSSDDTISEERNADIGYELYVSNLVFLWLSVYLTIFVIHRFYCCKPIHIVNTKQTDTTNKIITEKNL